MASPARAERRKRIAVYGGAFDPITDGHLKCACEIIHARAADEVWIVPCGTRPDKPSLRTPYLHRLIMCHLAVDTSFGSTFPIRVCDIEMAEARRATRLEPTAPATAEDAVPRGQRGSCPPSRSRASPPLPASLPASALPSTSPAAGTLQAA